MTNALATRFACTPVLVGREQTSWLEQCLTHASATLAKIRERELAGPVDDEFWPDEDSWRAVYRPYKVVAGTLMIPIKGVLLHNYGWQDGDWATGYTYIRKAFERGMADPAVQRIAMMIDSGGGEVAGNFDLVDQIYKMRGVKPIGAFVDEHAYSAAYSLASVADHIVVARSGGVGSIGVLTSHVDRSKMLEDYGMKITLIYAGEHKVDGNPYEPLPDDVKNRMQARVDGLYDIFVSTVGRNLGVDPQKIRDTQALCYDASEAVSIGLAHEIRQIDEALAAFSGGRNVTIGVTKMSQTTTPEIAQADLDAARAEGRAEGAKAERERIQAILSSEEAQTRRDQAFHMALNTELSVDVARGVLAASPEAQVAEQAAGTAFQQAMQTGNPDLGPEGDGEAASMTAAQILVRDFQQATGYTRSK